MVEAGRRILGVSGVCLMLLDAEGALRTLLTTDEALRELETAQTRSGEGPCIECVVMGRAVRTGDLRDDARWLSRLGAGMSRGLDPLPVTQTAAGRLARRPHAGALTAEGELEVGRGRGGPDDCSRRRSPP